MATRLDRLTVVETALRLLNETGLEGLSLRRIATELEVKAPALYWHFDSKQALLDEMATEILRGMLRDLEETGRDAGDLRGGDAEREPAGEARWQELVAESMRVLRRTLLGHRDGAKVFSGSTFTGTEHAAPMQRVLEPLVRQGFTVRAAGRAWFTAYSYTIGFVIEEQAVHPMPGQRDPRYDVERRAEQLAPRYPLVAEVGREFFEEFDEGFETGLTAVITGIAATLAHTA